MDRHRLGFRPFNLLVSAAGASLAAGVLQLNLLGPQAQAQQIGAPAGGQLSGPAPGVLCDAAGPVCYDAQGPSIGHTQTYFGRMAADRLSRDLAGRPPVRDFRLSNGAFCDTRASLCWSDGYSRRTVAPQLTHHLFGGAGHGHGGAHHWGGLELPRSGVVCDRREQRCYDRQGLSLGLTREYYGAYAEQAALRQLAGQAPPRAFRLSNGAACDTGAQRCWSDGWDRRLPDPNLTRQLFGQEGGGLTRQAQCRMTRWFKTLSSGSCELHERSGKRGSTLDVQLSDGSVYTFSKVRGEGYRLTDGKGNTWPVRLNDQGSSLSFSWSDRVLQVTPQRGPKPGGPSLGQLLDSLFGY